MSRLIRKLVLVSTVAATTGCGTLYSLVDSKIENKIYGGVQTDINVINAMANGNGPNSGINGSGSGAAAVCLVLVGLPIVDLGLSAVADTVLLPVHLLWDHLTTPTTPTSSSSPTPPKQPSNSANPH